MQHDRLYHPAPRSSTAGATPTWSAAGQGLASGGAGDGDRRRGGRRGRDGRRPGRPVRGRGARRPRRRDGVDRVLVGARRGESDGGRDDRDGHGPQDTRARGSGGRHTSPHLSTSPTTKNIDPRIATMSAMSWPGSISDSTETLLNDAERSLSSHGVFSPRETR